MLALQPIATAALLVTPVPDVPPYEIEPERDTEIDRVHLVVVTYYDEVA